MFVRRVVRTALAAFAASAFVGLTAGGCARNAAVEGNEGDAADDRPSALGTATRSSDVITSAELMAPAVRGGDALEAVRRLRPRFLNTRGRSSIRISGAGSVHVSLNGGPLQTLSFLQRMRPDEIAEIRFLNAAEATQRFGTSAGSGGVLLVKNK